MKQTFLLCICSAFLGGVGALVAWSYYHTPPTAVADAWGNASWQLNSGPSPVDPSSPLSPAGVFQETLSQEELINVNVYDATNRSVVNINCVAEVKDNFFRVAIPQEGSGSGWVLDLDGRIVTNNHVIANANKIDVTLFDGTTFPAMVVGTDPTTDVAVIQINAPKESLFPLVFGDSSQLKVGQKVLAIGNPFGLERTLTVGIISSLNRSLDAKRGGRTMNNIIQLDAALNQGNSGGPLMNSNGKLIGMNTAIASKTGENTGVGFAVPVNTIKRVLPELIRFGKVIRANLGVEAYLPTNQGVAIGYVEPDSPADKAGLRGLIVVEVRQFGNMMTKRQTRQTPDIIVEIDDQKVRTPDDVTRLLDIKKPGDQIALKISRGGKTLNVPVTLGVE